MTMLTISPRMRHLILIAGLAVLLGGCNIFEPFYGEGNDESVASLLDDARYALRNNDPSSAVSYAEQALALEPNNPEVRIVLSQALLQEQDVTVLQLKEVAEFIQGPESTATTSIQQGSMDVCNYNGVGSTYPQINLSTNEGYLRIEVGQHVLRRILGLFDGVTLTDLEANLAAQGYLIRSFASVGLAIIDIKRQSDATITTLHRLNDGSIGYCSATMENLLTLMTFIRCDQLQYFNNAIDDMQARINTLNRGAGSLGEELLDLLKEARNVITSTINVACTI